VLKIVVEFDPLSYYGWLGSLIFNGEKVVFFGNANFANDPELLFRRLLNEASKMAISRWCREEERGNDV